MDRDFWLVAFVSVFFTVLLSIMYHAMFSWDWPLAVIAAVISVVLGVIFIGVDW